MIRQPRNQQAFSSSVLAILIRPVDGDWEATEHLLDLVMWHHSLAVPVSRWKAIRARLGAGTAQTITFPPAGLPAFSREEFGKGIYREFHDHLRWDIAADTLFLTGSKKAFELEGTQIRQLAEECPALIARTPQTHCCAEIGVGRWKRGSLDRRRPFATLHIEICEVHR